MIHFLDLGHTPIFEQLKLEEALLRGTDLNFCIINRGSPRSIVMGISGKPENLLHLDKVQKDKIPVIKRFSGGGTVIVDEGTLLVTFILSKDAVPMEAFPEPILRWSGDIYEKSWKIPGFHVEENDYAIGPLKCGGNAQYIQKDRWLHHTSFLWDFQSENMAYLQIPEKQPKYRQNRSHLDFLCRLNAYGSKEKLVSALEIELIKRFTVKPIAQNDLSWRPHRETVNLVFNS